MAGMRQHYIPRFLQSGFSIEEKNKNCFTWVYRLDKEPFNTNTINNGVERYFYSDNMNTAVDDAITKIEPIFADLIANTKTNPKNNIDSNLLAAFVCHCEIRTKNIRQKLLNFSESTLQSNLDTLTNSIIFRKSIKGFLKDKKSKLHIKLNSEFKSKGFTTSQFLNLIKSDLFIDNAIREVGASLSDAIKIQLIPHLKNAIKEIQGIILSNNESSQFKIEKYKNYNYEYFTSNEIDIILGDSIVVFKNEKNDFSSFCEKESMPTQIIIPVSSTSFIMGHKGENHFELFELNSGIAKCSLDFFIHPEFSHERQKLQKLIGKSLHIGNSVDNEKIFFKQLMSQYS